MSREWVYKRDMLTFSTPVVLCSASFPKTGGKDMRKFYEKYIGLHCFPTQQKTKRLLSMHQHRHKSNHLQTHATPTQQQRSLAHQISESTKSLPSHTQPHSQPQPHLQQPQRKRLPRPASANTLTRKPPEILAMSTSLASRWSKHLQTQGLDPDSKRQHTQQQHVQRVRGVAASRAALLSQQAATAEAAATGGKRQRPQSAPGRRRSQNNTYATNKYSSSSNNNNNNNNNAAAATSPMQSPFERFGGDAEERPVVGIREFIDQVRTLRRKNIVKEANSLSHQAM